MDLQKVAPHTHNGVVRNGHGTDVTGQIGPLGLPFVDFVRSPMIATGELLANFGNRGAVDDARPGPDHRDSGPESNRVPDEPATRPESTGSRDRNGRDTDRQDRNNQTMDSQDSDNRGTDTAKRADDPSEERPDQGPARDTAPDDDRHDDGNAGGETSGSEQVPAQDHHRGRDAFGGDHVGMAGLHTGAGDDIPVVMVDDAGASTAAGPDPVADAVMQAVPQASQTTDPKQLAQDITQAVKQAVGAHRTESVTDARHPQEQALNARAEAEINTAVQQALRQITRQGTRIPGQPADAAAKATDQGIVQQQAQALSSTIKSDRPININVNVNDRAGVAVSQPSQALSANAVAAQNTQSTSPSLADTQQASGRPAQFQPATNAGAQNATQTNVQAQAQVAAQAAQAAVAGASDQGLTRATTLNATATQQGGIGGAEATSSTTSAGPAGQTQQAATAQRPQQAQAPRPAQQPQTLTQQISVNITKAIAEGMDRISIQLRPADMGRVEVKLTMVQDGRVSAQVIVERPETLEALRNDSRGLEKALQDAGLQTNAGDLDFNLRSQQENPEESDSDSRTADNDEDGIGGDLEAELAARILNGNLEDIITDTHVDIRA